MYPKLKAFKCALAFIIILEAGLLIGQLALDHQSKIWNKGSSALKPLTAIPGSFLAHNTTVVTAFFDIGPVKKVKNIRSKAIYFEWTKTFRYMRNALVVYTDSEPFRKHITAVRSKLSAITEILMVNRSLLWSFQNLPKIKQIYKLKTYPDSLYTCVTHAKFDSLSKATQDNTFRTKYFMWLDLGYFRHRKSRRLYHFPQPKKFNDSKIAITQVNELGKYSIPKEILIGNHRDVAGALMYGERTRVMLFVKDFKRAVQYFLSKNLTNYEEPLLTAMYSDEGKQILKPAVELQLYRKGKLKDWNYLGNKMITEENIPYF